MKQALFLAVGSYCHMLTVVDEVGFERSKKAKGK